MTNEKQFRIAKNLLGTFRDVWCDRLNAEEKPWFNCDICDFVGADGRCMVKVFMKSDKFANTNNDYSKGILVTSEVEDGR